MVITVQVHISFCFSYLTNAIAKVCFHAADILNENIFLIAKGIYADYSKNLQILKVW